MKWKYRVWTIVPHTQDYKQEDLLIKEGRDGWELVAVIPTNNYILFYLKQPIKENNDEGIV